MRTEVTDYVDAPSVRVAKWLISKGYYCAGINDHTDLLERVENALVVIFRDPNWKPRKFLWFEIDDQGEEGIFPLGVIWFRDLLRGANDRRWVFEVRGRNNFDLAKSLADSLASGFGVDISLQLVAERPHEMTTIRGFSSKVL